MAINRVAIPTPTAPVALADYQAQLDQITALNQAFTGRNIVDGSTIHAGSVMMIGGVLYKSTTDTTITGTPSKFAKITPSGATAAAAFVASLSGVAWNHAYGGYYDGTGNLYLFDEARAVNDGDISTAYTMQGQIAYLKGGLDINGALTGATTIGASGAISGASIGVSGAIYGASVGVSGAITGASLGASGAVSGATVSASGDISAHGVAVAPLPNNVSGGLGQFCLLTSPGTEGSVLTLPTGGSWAYFFDTGNYHGAGVADGGTVIASPGLVTVWALAWRVQ